jgi:hypothetical protein
MMGASTTVPICWYAAEQAALDLVTRVDGEAAVATFEYRATSDVLALTWTLAEIAIPSATDPIPSIRQLYAHLSSERQWLAWSHARLLRPPAGLAQTDLWLADQAWSRLIRGGLLAGFTVSGVTAEPLSSTACRIGFHHARRILDAYGDRRP